MSTIEFRPMKAEDLPAVARLEADTFSEPWSEKSFAEALEKAYYLFVVGYEGMNLVAQAGCIQSFQEGTITNVAVAKQYRGRGIGDALMDYLLNAGTQRGIEDYTLEVRQSNEPAIALYKKKGFTEAGLRKNFFQHPQEHGIIMWKYMEKSV